MRTVKTMDYKIHNMDDGTFCLGFDAENGLVSITSSGWGAHTNFSIHGLTSKELRHMATELEKLASQAELGVSNAE